MANLNRVPKSGNDWSIADLMAYNITILPCSPDNFFTTHLEQSLDHIDPAILNSVCPGDILTLSDSAAAYLNYLHLATTHEQVSFVDNFAAETLRLLGFNEHSTIVSQNYSIPCIVSYDYTHFAETGVCLISLSSLVLLVVIQDKTPYNTDADPLVAAAAIAAFQDNNDKREMSGRLPLDDMTIPCIAMSKTRPTFYLVPVTKELGDAVMRGQHPAHETQVLRCVTPAYPPIIGMEDKQYRKVALQRFLAFKALAKSHWMRILGGPWLDEDE
ncbi:hypothetical protein H0H92_009240 [Tricholoma furcatifolium]|nr:hypothetical protein H0H92_009240 [Tricholoma furcatifolium]